jgi:peptide/nickel transport system permease protein
VVETVFSYPGLGRALEQAVSQRDIPLVQTIVVLLAVFYVIVNLVADVLVVLVTPRLRVSGGDAPETVVDAMAVAAEPLA